jgi:hypothetical protein
MNASVVSRLAPLHAAGLVRRASDRVDEGVERSLPVTAALRPLLPGGCLRRGSTVAIGHGPAGRTGSGTAPGMGVGSGTGTGTGTTSLLFALLAEASIAGSWCAAIGLPGLGLIAAAEAGVVLERFALVPYPGPEWAETVAALLDGLDIVVVNTPAGVPAQLASRVAARARQRGAVLVSVGSWPGADITLDVVRSSWHGLGEGVGRLRRREAEVLISGRGAAARSRRARVWLPDLDSHVTSINSPALTLVSSDTELRRAS